MNTTFNIEHIATLIDQAILERREVNSFRDVYPFTLNEAYKIQNAGIALREARGEQRVGMKLGFTSRAKMQQMGVDHLIWGVITDTMRLEEGGEIDLSKFIHPRIEPEIAFITAKDISSPLTLAEALGMIEGIAPAMEIIDSRYRAFKFTLEDVVADNTSSAGFVLGQLHSINSNIDNAGVIMSVNGRGVEFGSTAAILGKPLRALVQISALLHASEQTLPAGSIILAGAATAAFALATNQSIRTEIQGLGSLEIYTGE